MKQQPIQPYIVELPRIFDPRGSLTFVENNNQVPFEIARCYWTYDIPSNEERGGHSHYQQWELLVAVAGCFNVNVYQGSEWQTFTLDRPYRGLLIPAGWWRTLDNFASGSVCLVMASGKYDEADYQRDFKIYNQELVEQ